MLDSYIREAKVKQMHAIFEAAYLRISHALTPTELGKPVTVYAAVSEVGRSWVDSGTHPLLTHNSQNSIVQLRTDVKSPVPGRDFKNSPWNLIYAQEFVDLFRSTGWGHYKMQLRINEENAALAEITLIETTGCVFDSDSKISSTRTTCLEHIVKAFPVMMLSNIVVGTVDEPFGFRTSYINHDLAVSIWHMFSGTKELVRG